MTQPVLIVFGGLPGTGKTTIARALAARLSAVYLRIDAIEQAMIGAGAERIGAAGYVVAQALASANLLPGRVVVADCVNPVHESRFGWRAAADEASARLIDIVLVCSDPAEHRRRVETRAADIPGHVLPRWDAVLGRDFEPYQGEHLLLDTAMLSPPVLVERCVAYVGQREAE